MLYCCACHQPSCATYWISQLTDINHILIFHVLLGFFSYKIYMGSDTLFLYSRKLWSFVDFKKSHFVKILLLITHPANQFNLVCQSLKLCTEWFNLFAGKLYKRKATTDLRIIPDKMRELLPSCSLVSCNCITEQTPILDSKK